MRSLLQGSRVIVLMFITAVVIVSGCNKSSDSDTSIFTPALYTSPVVSGLTATTAQTTGYVTNFITGTVSAYGVCYSSTNKTPTIGDSKSELTTSGVIHYVNSITGLTANTLYYLRTYAVHTSGTFYGNVIQFTTPTATFTIAGTSSTYAGSGAAGSSDGALRSASFSSPQGIVADASGNLYVADSFNNLIRKISTTGAVTTIAGSTTAGFTNGTGTAARFYSPQNIAIDATGNLYVSDVGNNAIRKITPAGVVTTYAGGNGAGYADGSGTTVKFYNPAGLAVDAAGNVFVADRSNHCIRKITTAGVVSTYAGINSRGFNDGASTDARFNTPAAVAVDAQNNLYVADLGNNALRYIAADGTVNTYAGDPTLRADVLNLPTALAFDKAGNLFIADGSGRIIELTVAKTLFSIAGNINTAAYTEGKGTAAAFSNPQGLTTDAAGNVYVADYNNNVIRKLVVSTTP